MVRMEDSGGWTEVEKHQQRHYSLQTATHVWQTGVKSIFSMSRVGKKTAKERTKKREVTLRVKRLQSQVPKIENKRPNIQVEYVH